jgi:hypothetical protein
MISLRSHVSTHYCKPETVKTINDWKPERLRRIIVTLPDDIPEA